MQLVETTSPPPTRRGGTVRVSWTDLADQQRRRGEEVRALPPGEHVVVQLGGDTFHVGHVVSYLGSGVQGAYVVSIGAPMSQRSGRWLAASGNRATAPDALDDEVAAVVRIPAQRTG